MSTHHPLAVELSSFDRLCDKRRRLSREARERRAEQWREILTRPLVDRIVHDHAGQMARLGYLPSGRGGIRAPPVRALQPAKSERG